MTVFGSESMARTFDYWAGDVGCHGSLQRIRHRTAAIFRDVPQRAYRAKSEGKVRHPFFKGLREDI